VLSQVEVAKHPVNTNDDRILDVRAGDCLKTVSGGRMKGVKVHAA
jgi:hypothetical protein